MKKILLLLAIIGAFTLQAQQFEVVKTQKIKVEGTHYHPLFMPDGRSLLVSGESFDGLGIINLSTGKFRQITNEAGAGYMPSIQNDDKTVVYRTIDFASQKQILNAFDTENFRNRQIGYLYEHVNRLNAVGGDVCYAENGIVKSSSVIAGSRIKKSVPRNAGIYVTEEDLKVVVYNNGVRTVIDPLSTPERDVNYCWSSISPDKTKIMFVGGNNAYICNLDGSNLVELGLLHAPVWRGNDYVVGMVDEDDGHQFTKSDIVIMDVNGGKRQQLTQPSDEIKMYPSVSSDGSKIAYHTTEGSIYLMTIKET